MAFIVQKVLRYHGLAKQVSGSNSSLVHVVTDLVDIVFYSNKKYWKSLPGKESPITTAPNKLHIVQVYFTENVQDIDPYFGIKSYDLLYQLTLKISNSQRL